MVSRRSGQSIATVLASRCWISNAKSYTGNRITPGVQTDGISQGEEPVFTILDSVAEREGTDPLHLPPLGEVVDTDALTALLGGGTMVSASFEYNGYEVRVDSDGGVSIG